jgi:hypothetical protein
MPLRSTSLSWKRRIGGRRGIGAMNNKSDWEDGTKESVVEAENYGMKERPIGRLTQGSKNCRTIRKR